MKKRTLLVAIAGGLTLTGCKDDGDDHIYYNPPPPTPEATPPTSNVPLQTSGTLPDKPLPTTKAPWETGQPQLNPKDPEHGTVYRGVAGCYVNLPFPTPPKAVIQPPQKAVTCPDAMADFLWTQCMDGEVFPDAETEACVCTVSGNPPPPPAWIHCPPTSVAVKEEPAATPKP